MNSARVLLWSCVALFGARVIGQFEALLLSPDWLPDMDAWYSGLMPYTLLVPSQIAILMLMSVVAWNRRIRTGAFARKNPRAATALRIFAAVYFIAMAVRLAVEVVDNGTGFWRHGAIPVAFHWVLALFVLVAGRDASASGRVRIPARQRDADDDDVPHGDVPAIAQPLQVRYCHAG